MATIEERIARIETLIRTFAQVQRLESRSYFDRNAAGEWQQAMLELNQQLEGFDGHRSTKPH